MPIYCLACGQDLFQLDGNFLTENLEVCCPDMSPSVKAPVSYTTASYEYGDYQLNLSFENTSTPDADFMVSCTDQRLRLVLATSSYPQVHAAPLVSASPDGLTTGSSRAALVFSLSHAPCVDALNAVSSTYARQVSSTENLDAKLAALIDVTIVDFEPDGRTTLYSAGQSHAAYQDHRAWRQVFAPAVLPSSQHLLRKLDDPEARALLLTSDVYVQSPMGVTSPPRFTPDEPGHPQDPFAGLESPAEFFVEERVLKKFLALSSASLTDDTLHYMCHRGLVPPPRPSFLAFFACKDF